MFYLFIFMLTATVKHPQSIMLPPPWFPVFWGTYCSILLPYEPNSCSSWPDIGSQITTAQFGQKCCDCISIRSVLRIIFFIHKNDNNSYYYYYQERKKTQNKKYYCKLLLYKIKLNFQIKLLFWWTKLLFCWQQAFSKCFSLQVWEDSWRMLRC